MNGLSLRLADAPPALAMLHFEHVERQTRLHGEAEARREQAQAAELWRVYVDVIQRLHTMSCCWTNGGRPLATLDVVRAVCRRYGMKRRRIMTRRRTPDLVWPRWVAIYLCRRLTAASWSRIGFRLGLADHTTVLHGYRRIEAAAFGAEPDLALRAELAAIAASLGQRL